MYPRNHYNNKKTEKKYRTLNRLIRKNCCWNCLQIGHLRFQCPYPKMIRCSFCRKPFVLTINCDCRGRSSNVSDVSAHQEQRCSNAEQNMIPLNQEYSVSVMVPVNFENGTTHSVIEDNIVVFVDNAQEQVDNEDDRDILEIHAESESLDEL